VNAPYFILFIAMLSLGLFLFVFLRTKVNNVEGKKEAQNCFEKKVVILYLVPWLLFSIINVTLAKNNSTHIFEQTSASFYVLLIALQVIGVCFGAIIAGFVADFFGRRIVLAVTLSLYGTSSALGGIFTNPQVFSVMYFINGMSWGILFVMYIFVVWGDLANKDNCAKMYSLGAITYFLSLGIGAIIPQTFLPLGTSSLLICLIIFLSILPIFMAPELATTDFIEGIKLKRHINTVKKLKKNQG
jgi:MFS family permease